MGRRAGCDDRHVGVGAAELGGSGQSHGARSGDRAPGRGGRDPARAARDRGARAATRRWPARDRPPAERPRRAARGLGRVATPALTQREVALDRGTGDARQVTDELEVEMELIYEWTVDDDDEDHLEDDWFHASDDGIASIEDAPRPRRDTLSGRVLRLIGWRTTDVVAA